MNEQTWLLHLNKRSRYVYTAFQHFKRMAAAEKGIDQLVVVVVVVVVVAVVVGAGDGRVASDEGLGWCRRSSSD